MLADSTQTTLHKKITYNFVWIYLGQHCTKKLPAQLAHGQQITFMRKITYTVLCRSCWDNSAQIIISCKTVHLSMCCQKRCPYLCLAVQPCMFLFVFVYFLHFLLVDFLLTHCCQKSRVKIVQIWPTLCKKAFGTILHKKTRLGGTSELDHNK